MTAYPQILSGLREIAPGYDALICDVWGVLHNGRVPNLAAAAALNAFRRMRGPVVLLSNAPRPLEDMEEQFRHIGVPLDCYDGIMTSGMATRAELARRAEAHTLPLLHIGPPRDNGVFTGLDIALSDAENAQIVLCTGLWDDDTETPEDYAALLDDLRSRNLTILCANPDIVVQRGDRLVYCAGALAEAYEKRGGPVIYFGKPHRPVYDAALALAANIAGRVPQKPLAIGDGMDTDIKGADRMGIDALFIADGIHASQLGDLTAEGVAQLLAVREIRIRAAMRTLVW